MNHTSRRVRSTLAAVLALLATGAANAATMDITVTNTSPRDVDGIYLAATAQSAWGPDQIEADLLESGSSLTLQGVSCTSASLVVVAEDVAGCFLYQTIACGGAATWTISNATPRDCGR